MIDCFSVLSSIPRSREHLPPHNVFPKKIGVRIPSSFLFEEPSQYFTDRHPTFSDSPIRTKTKGRKSFNFSKKKLPFVVVRKTIEKTVKGEKNIPDRCQPPSLPNHTNSLSLSLSIPPISDSRPPAPPPPDSKPKGQRTVDRP